MLAYGIYVLLMGTIITYLAIQHGSPFNIHFFLVAIGLDYFIYFPGKTKQGLQAVLVFLMLYFCLGILTASSELDPIAQKDLIVHEVGEIIASFFPFFLLYKAIQISSVITALHKGTFQPENLRIKKEKALRKSENRYRTLFEASSEGILIVDIEKGAALDCNLRMQTLFHSDKQGIKEGNMLTFSPDHQPDGRRSSVVLHEILKEFREKKTVLRREWKFKRADGLLFDAEVTFSPMELDHRMVSVMLVRDITEMKRAREELGEKMQELDEKNQELKKYIGSNLQLENFAYMASHDLKEPLRTIIGFSQLLENRYSTKLDAQGKEFLSFISDATKNMHQLISDLLRYSRVDTDDYRHVYLKFPPFLQSVIQGLGGLVESLGAKIIVEEIPEEIYGDKIKLQQLFQNIIVNGLKFHRPGTQPIINITCEDTGKYWTFGIADNGIGISEEFQEKIFLLFRKLHTKDKYEGTGIGLALAKRVVDQHGGKIWVKSEGRQGTVFYFTLLKGPN